MIEVSIWYDCLFSLAVSIDSMSMMRSMPQSRCKLMSRWWILFWQFSRWIDLISQILSIKSWCKGRPLCVYKNSIRIVLVLKNSYRLSPYFFFYFFFLQSISFLWLTFILSVFVYKVFSFLWYASCLVDVPNRKEWLWHILNRSRIHCDVLIFYNVGIYAFRMFLPLLTPSFGNFYIVLLFYVFFLKLSCILFLRF